MGTRKSRAAADQHNKNPEPPCTPHGFSSRGDATPLLQSGQAPRSAVSPAAYNRRVEDAADTGQREITCLIVDDHEVVREGIRISLSNTPHIRVVGEAGDGEAAVALVERRHPNVVIMDVRMPGMDGLEATKLVTEKAPDSHVLIFTAYSERSLLGRGLESGAKGYILKEAPRDTLIRAIEKVAKGETFVDPALMTAFLPGARAPRCSRAASARSSSSSPTACPTRTSPSAYSSARRP